MSIAQTSPRDIVTFQRVCPRAMPLLRADTSALGILPTATFQYCEAARSASAYGWYVFPPSDIVLRWDGTDVFLKVEDDWTELSSVHLDADFLAYWAEHAPADLRDRAPPTLTSLFVPGIVQIWSGFFASTAPGWSLLVGPVVNMPQSRAFSCYEAIVETDSFKPWPMFINIKLQSTEREIRLSRMKPLFQVRPVLRECYSGPALNYNELSGLEPRHGTSGSMTAQDWEGYRTTVRSVEPVRAEDDREPGSYGASVRRRRKGQDQRSA
jgi:hypothetical protein